jgi:plasmid stabilization system protein ParE
MSATKRFADAVDAALQAILADPYRWPKEDDQIRSIRVKRFPYVIYFDIVDDSTALLLAVAHTSRRPGYWKRRVKRR